MSLEELDTTITQVLSGSKISQVTAEDGTVVPILFKNPASKDLLLANHVYNVYLKKSKEAGLLSSEEMKQDLIKRGLYSNEDDTQLEEIKKQIELARKKKIKFSGQKKFIEQLDKTVSDLATKYNTIAYKLAIHDDRTCENRAAEEKLVYLTFVCSFDPYTDAPIWPTWEVFNEEADVSFRNGTIREFSRFYSGLPTKIVRYIARNPLWRLRYIASTKTGGNLYSVPIADYSLDQLNLIYWSNYYLSLYEMMPDDIPPDDIVDDDDALDAYMSLIREEREKELAERRQEKLGRFSKRGAFAHEEVIVTAHDPNFQAYTYTKIKKPVGDQSSMTEKSLREKTRQTIKDKLRQG